MAYASRKPSGVPDMFGTAPPTGGFILTTSLCFEKNIGFAQRKGRDFKYLPNILYKM